MPRRNANARKGGNQHSRAGGGWMKTNKGTGAKQRRKRRIGDAAPLTPGSMHSRTRIR